MAREIKHIVCHCTATPLTTTVESIVNYWRNVLGWRSMGYHYLIREDGTWEQLAEHEQVCNGVRGYNQHAIHVATIGGRVEDDRTDAQKFSQLHILRRLITEYPDAEILGHRDFPNVAKACPQYDVKKFLEEVGFLY